MHDLTFSDEVLARHRCRIDERKLVTAPITEWTSIRERAKSIEVLRAQIEQINFLVEASYDADRTWTLKRRSQQLADIIKTIYPMVKP